MIDCQPETQITTSRYTVPLRTDSTQRRGRPPTYTQQVADTICKHIRNATTRRYAAQAAGIDEQTLYDWLQTREDFSQAVACAEGELFAEASAVVAGGMRDSLQFRQAQTALELLKRRDRASWGDTLDIRKLDTADLVKLLDAQSTAQELPAVTESGDELL